jgi:uncharacterized coiled-coil protein SlyX
VIGSANLPLQKPEDAPQSDVAAPATQSEPSLERSTRNNTAVEAATSSVSQGIQQHVSTRSPSPASLGAARSSSTSSAPPTEAADKSTQSQSQPQNQPSSKSPSQNKLSVVESPSDQSARNQDSAQNTVSVQPQATTQQSHVEQAAQEVSFQQPPTQQRPTFDFVQSSAEEVTTSSLRFDTQILPTHQVSAQHILTQGGSTLSSPSASLPSNLPNTIGDSAPSPIKSLSDSGTSRQNTRASNMTPELNPDGTPKRESVKSKLAKMRAANQARRDAEKNEAEQAAAARLVTSTPTASRIAAPILDMHSPKPASAVPARLMSPAITEREARSPSTVPPVEIIPEETPEQNARSERYETLLPGQGPQISTDTSRPYISEDNTMHDDLVDTEPDNNQHLISLEWRTTQRDHYICAVETNTAMVENFTSSNGVLSAGPNLIQQVRDTIIQLHHIVNHVDLCDPNTAIPSQASKQSEWDMSISTKFRFLKSLLDEAKQNNLHVALLVDPGRLAAILQGFLQGINIMYNVIDGLDNVVNHNSTATILLTTVESIDTSSLDMDMVVVIDGSISKDVVTRSQKMLSNDTLVPTISLIIPHSIEHIERCLPATMPEADRLHILMSTASNERKKAGWQSAGTDTDFERKASDIVSWTLNPGAADWPFYGPPSLKLTEGHSQSSEDELMDMDNSGSNKRSLQDDHELISTKRARIEESLPLTINPADMHLTPGTMLTNSHVSDSVAASQHAITLQELNNAQAQIRELFQAMETLQFNCEEQRAEMVKAQKERNDALQREERLSTTNTDLRAKNGSLRDEVLDLKKQLEVAQAALLDHTVPERAELEKSKAEALAAVTERDKEVKRAKTFEESVDYLRSQYQTRSNENSLLATSNAEYEKKIAELEIKASGEQAKLKAINNATLVKRYESTIKQLRTVVTEREGTMQRMSEEMARLREPRGRVGTRASSIPRSPRAGTREPVSRQGSPSVQRPHPLRKEN